MSSSEERFRTATEKKKKPFIASFVLKYLNNKECEVMTVSSHTDYC
ncbi:hypothetical protein [Winogradskyella wichelsiae]|nr:hypothetical protein [Winogradskyella wichelsiae]